MTPPRWLSAPVLLAIHGELLVDHGGRGGVGDGPALAAALEGPRGTAAAGTASLAESAAAFGFAIARSGPCSDGNLRTALAAMDVFLRLHGHEIDAPEAEAVLVLRDLAGGAVDEEELAAWIRSRMVALPRD